MKRWNMVKLRSIVLPPMSGEWGDDGDTVKVLRTTNFTNEGRLDLEKVVSRHIDSKKIEKKKLQFGDTIIEKSGGSPNQPVGRVVYFDEIDDEYLCNNFTSVVRLKEDSNDSKYLFWFLFNQHLTQKTLSYQNKTTGIINLQLTRYVDELQIPLPPLAIQKQIAARLDAADALRQKDRQLLDRYDTLTQSVFMQLFGDPVRNEKGWRVEQAKHVISDIVAGSSWGGEERKLQKNEFGVLKISAVTSGTFKPNEIKVVPNETIKDKNLIFPKKGDLLFSRANTRELVAATCIVDKDYDSIFLPDNTNSDLK